MLPSTQQRGNYVQAQADETSFHLGLGQPSPRLLPLEEVRQSSAEFFEGADPLLLQYNRAAGAQSLRAAIAQWLGQARGHNVSPDSLVVSGGNSQALDWVSSSLSAPGDRVFSENPSYFLAAQIIRGAGLEIQSIPITGEGICTRSLEEKLNAGIVPRWVYCIPTHHNPTGVNLSRARLDKLLALSDKHDFLVVFDDPYSQLHFGEQNYSVLDEAGALRSGNWLRLGSFSKIFAPGLRLGWIEASSKIQEGLLSRGMMRSGGGLNPMSGAIVEQALRSGRLQNHHKKIRQALAGRHTALREAQEKLLPSAKLWPITGGYFAWLELESNFPTRDFARYCRERGLIFLAGELCCPDGKEKWSHALRISLSFYEEEELRAAVERLAELKNRFGG